MTLGIDWFTGVVDRALTAYQINPVVHSLVIDGIFAGVGSVLSFLPTIVILFFFLSILEDTGYMARVAFVMDNCCAALGFRAAALCPCWWASAARFPPLWQPAPFPVSVTAA